jgi:Ran GTPase-activating protein (RanGAP) involved in mRNA processing and transport
MYTNRQVLNISDNKVKRQGSLALADALRSCTKLTTLLMESCHVKDVGARALVPVLKGGKQLNDITALLYKKWSP